MKKYILMSIALLGTHQLFSADIEQPSSELPTELKALIIQKLAVGKNLEEYVESIKNLISTNKSWYTILNDADSIQPLLKEMGKQFGISELVMAFCLNTRGARAWLQKQNSEQNFNKNLLVIFAEVTRTGFIDSGFIKTKYFTQLANQLGIELVSKGGIDGARSSFRQINKFVNEIKQKFSNFDIYEYVKCNFQLSYHTTSQSRTEFYCAEDYSDMLYYLRILSLQLIELQQHDSALLIKLINENPTENTRVMLAVFYLLIHTLEPHIKHSIFKDKMVSLLFDEKFYTYLSNI